jgi:hypothetical protein
MTKRIRIDVSATGVMTCTNASPEKVAIRLPHAPNYLIVEPNTKFEGTYQDRKREPLGAALPSEIELREATYPSVIRRAGPDDIGSLLMFVPQILSEAELLPISAQKVERLVERCANQDRAVAGVIDGPDGIDATLGLVLAESEISDQTYIKAVWCGLHPSVRRHSGDEADPRARYGRTLLEFARWCHAGLEREAGRPVLIQFDVATRRFLGKRLGLYHRNLRQVGATFALGAVGDYMIGDVGELEAA